MFRLSNERIEEAKEEQGSRILTMASPSSASPNSKFNDVNTVKNKRKIKTKLDSGMNTPTSKKTCLSTSSSMKKTKTGKIKLENQEEDKKTMPTNTPKSRSQPQTQLSSTKSAKRFEKSDQYDALLGEAHDLMGAAAEAQALGRLKLASSYMLLLHARLIGLGKIFDRAIASDDRLKAAASSLLLQENQSQNIDAFDGLQSKLKHDNKKSNHAKTFHSKDVTPISTDIGHITGQSKKKNKPQYHLNSKSNSFLDPNTNLASKTNTNAKLSPIMIAPHFSYSSPTTGSIRLHRNSNGSIQYSTTTNLNDDRKEKQVPQTKGSIAENVKIVESSTMTVKSNSEPIASMWKSPDEFCKGPNYNFATKTKSSSTSIPVQVKALPMQEPPVDVPSSVSIQASSPQLPSEDTPSCALKTKKITPAKPLLPSTSLSSPKLAPNQSTMKSSPSPRNASIPSSEAAILLTKSLPKGINLDTTMMEHLAKAALELHNQRTNATSINSFSQDLISASSKIGTENPSSKTTISNASTLTTFVDHSLEEEKKAKKIAWSEEEKQTCDKALGIFGKSNPDKITKMMGGRRTETEVRAHLKNKEEKEKVNRELLNMDMGMGTGMAINVKEVRVNTNNQNKLSKGTKTFSTIEKDTFSSMNHPKKLLNTNSSSSQLTKKDSSNGDTLVTTLANKDNKMSNLKTGESSSTTCSKPVDKWNTDNPTSSTDRKNLAKNPPAPLAQTNAYSHFDARLMIIQGGALNASSTVPTSSSSPSPAISVSTSSGQTNTIENK